MRTALTIATDKKGLQLEPRLVMVTPVSRMGWRERGTQLPSGGPQEPFRWKRLSCYSRNRNERVKEWTQGQGKEINVICRWPDQDDRNMAPDQEIKEEYFYG